MCCVISMLVRCLLGIVISLLMTLGLILMVVGALLLWGFSTIMSSVYSIESQISTFLNKIGVNGNGQNVMNLIASNASSIGAIAFGVGVVLVAFALAMIVIMCFFSVKMILIVVVILLSTLTVCLIGISLYYGTNSTNMIMNPLQKYIQTDVINKYVGMNATNPESIVVNVIQIAVQCCGLSNYSDFNSAPNFYRPVKLDNGTVINMTFPISCCNYNTDFTIKSDQLSNCTNNQVSNNMNNGCWDIVAPKMKTYLNYCFATMGITIGVLVGVIAMLVVVICFIDKIP